jgi:hypothetical protein
MRQILILPLLAAALAGTACGSSHAAHHSSTAPVLTPAAFRARANEVCRAFRAKAAALRTPKTLAQAVVWIDRMNPLVAVEGSRLRALSPPSAAVVAYGQLLDSTDAAMQLASHLRQVAAAGNLRRFRLLAALSVRRQRAFDETARSIGLDDCVGLR